MGIRWKRKRNWNQNLFPHDKRDVHTYIHLLDSRWSKDLGAWSSSDKPVMSRPYWTDSCRHLNRSGRQDSRYVHMYGEYPEKKQHNTIYLWMLKVAGEPEKWPTTAAKWNSSCGEILFLIQASIEFRYLLLFKLIFAPYWLLIGYFATLFTLPSPAVCSSLCICIFLLHVSKLVIRCLFASLSAVALF